MRDDVEPNSTAEQGKPAAVVLELDILYTALNQLTLARTCAEVLEAISGYPKSTGATAGALLWPDGNTGSLPDRVEVAAEWTVTGTQPYGSAGSYVSPDQIPAFELISAGFETPLLIPDVTESDLLKPATRESLHRAQIYSLAFLPLKAGDRLTGILSFIWDKPHTFGESERRITLALANQASHQAGLMRNLEIERRNTAILKTVAQVSASTASSPDMAELLKSLAALTRQSFGLDHTHIYLLDSSGENLALAAGTCAMSRQLMQSGHRIPLNLEHSPVAAAGRTRQTIQVSNIADAPDFIPDPLWHGTRSVLAVPLIAGSTLIGVLDLQDNRVDQFTNTDVQVLATLADQISMAVQNANAYRQVLAAEQELEERANFLQGLLDSLPNPVFYKDREGRYQGCNEAWLKVLGTRREEIMGKSVYDLNPKELADIYFAMDQELFGQPGGVQVYESLVRYSDGTSHPVIFNKAILTNSDGSPWGLVGVVTDITERKQTEEALRSSEEKYRSLVESTDAAITVADAGGNYLFVNNVAAAPFGVAPEKLVGKNVCELFPAPEASQIMADIDRVINTGQGRMLEVQVTLAGKLNWFRTNLQPVRDGAAKTYAMLAYSYNITEEKKIQQAILAQNELLHQSKDLIALADLEGKLTYINQAGVKLLGGAQPEQFYGRPLADFHTPADAQLVLNRYLPEAIKTGRWRGENRLKTLDGRLVEVEQTIFPILDNTGNIIQTASIIADITERKRAEETIRASEEKYRSLIESTDAAISMVARNGDYLFLNQIAAEPFGVAPEQLVGKNIRELFPPEEAEQIQSDIEQIIAKNKGQTIEVEVTLATTKRWVRVSTQPVLDGAGNPYATMFFAMDITEKKEAELAVLLQNELLHQSRDFIGMANDQGVITFINQGAVNMMGMENPESLIGTHIAHYHPPEDATRMRDEAIPYALAHGQWRGENRLKRLDGSLIDVEQNLFPIRDRQGNFVQIATIMTDITERKKARTALEEANQLLEQRVTERTAELERVKNRLEAIFNHSGDAILMLSLTEGIQQANHTFSELFEVQFEDYLGQQFGKYFAPENLALIEKTIQEVALSHSKQVIEARTVGTGIEVEISLAPVNRTTSAVGSLVCIIRDITERKQAEIALRESEEKFRQFIESAPISAVITDKESRIVLVNREAENLFGYGREELVGQGVEMLVPQELRNNDRLQCSAYFSSAENRPVDTGETFARHKNGTVFPIDFKLSYIENQTRSLVISFIQDITRRKQVEQTLKEALAQEKELGDLKSRFVSTASHEFRTPLASILATAETLINYRERMTQDQIDIRLGKIKQQVLHLKDIIEDVLQLARMQAVYILK